MPWLTPSQFPMDHLSSTRSKVLSFFFFFFLIIVNPHVIWFIFTLSICISIIYSLSPQFQSITHLLPDSSSNVTKTYFYSKLEDNIDQKYKPTFIFLTNSKNTKIPYIELGFLFLWSCWYFYRFCSTKSWYFYRFCLIWKINMYCEWDWPPLWRRRRRQRSCTNSFVLNLLMVYTFSNRPESIGS